MSEPFLGEIIMFGGNFAPRGWALCDGQLLPISSNSALFSILGTNFGGDGRTTFGLPDLRGRVAIHSGHGPALSDYRLGEKGGNEQVPLTSAAQLPPHGHTLGCNNGVSGEDDPESLYLGAGGGDIYATVSNTNMAADAIGSTGNSQPHPNIQPYQSVNFIIALQGVFPSRN